MRPERRMVIGLGSSGFGVISIDWEIPFLEQ